MVVSKSSVPNGSDGVFAKRRILPGQLVCFFSGLKTYDEFFWSPNMTDAETEEAYAVVFNFGGNKQGYENKLKIDVPPKSRDYWLTYRTTSGYKVNHKFKDTNANS